MDNLLFYVTFLIFGLAFMIWGFFIIGSDQFYEWWRDRYWKEKKDGHLTKDSLIYNRYVTGTGTLIFGLGIVYSVIIHFPL